MKMRLQLGIYLMFLVLWVDRCDAWWFSWTDDALALTPDREGSGDPAGGEENIAGVVGAEIIDVVTGIRESVQTWDGTTEATPLTVSRPESGRVSGAVGTSPRRGQPDESGVSLLQLIGDPPPDEITKTYGPDNTPSYVFGPDSNTGQLARAHLPSPFYRDFSLLFNLKPTSDKAGVIFSVTDASQQIMYVGVKLSAVQGGRQNIILYYTEPDSQESYEAARFAVPSLRNIWTRFSVAVRDDKVTLYINCDSDPLVVRFERSPDEMELEAGAGVFVGQAGGADPDKFLGVIGDLRVIGNSRVAERHCEDEEDDSDVASGEGSGLVESLPPRQPPQTGSGRSKDERIATTPPSSRPIQQPPVTTRKEDIGSAEAKGERGDRGYGGEKGDRGPIGPKGESGSGSSSRGGVRGGKGEPGEKGFKGSAGFGYPGNKGETGPSGPPGPPGPPGPTAQLVNRGDGSVVQRLAGPPGPTGPPGAAGSQGTPGDDGEPGDPGEDGSAGAVGPPGFPGTPGDSGTKGDKGDAGDITPGPRGLPGPPGPPGPGSRSTFVDMEGSGFTDLESVRGLPGLPGLPGPPGPPGPLSGGTAVGSGAFGAPGRDGAPGQPGLPGLPGPDGRLGTLGAKGDKGDSGENGLRGAVGEKGGHGNSGLPGTPGEIGLAGLPGPIGPSGQPGPPGPPGPSYRVGFDDMEGSGAVFSNGIPGARGPDGKQGGPGVPGLPGKAGLPGIPGQKGSGGPEGRDGRPGLDGFPGPQGAKGERGNTGETGESGLDGTGHPGLPGPPGPPGQIIYQSSGSYDGAAGAVGPKGGAGLPGQAGFPGPMGPKGDRGDSGPQGYGIKGEKGEPGLIVGPDGNPLHLGGLGGEKGDRGPAGPVGPSGQYGPAGIKGEFGMPGRPGRPGVNGYKGEKGDPTTGSGYSYPGPAGPPGPPGPPGPAIPIDRFNRYDDASRNYPATKGEKGDHGDHGLPGVPGTASNFDIYTFKNEMKGQRGDSGVKGEKGEPSGGYYDPRFGGGVQGTPGAPGIPGLQGPKGDSLIGPPGPQGPPGAPGIGYDGRQGVPGQPGPPGPPGSPSLPGAYRPNHPVSVPGPPGPAGPQGVPGHSSGVTVLRSYDIMVATARRQAEGSLIYILDKSDLYLRVRDGLRQIVLGEYNPFYRDLDNEVAAVEPPPVVLYPQSHDQSNNNGAEHYSQGGPATRPLEPPPHQPVEPPRREPTRPDPRYPPQYDPRFPDPRYPSHTDGRYHPSHPVTPQRRPSPPVPVGHVHTSGPGLHLIALNSPQVGNMRGIRGADFLCFQQARAVGLRGTFRAYLSSKLQDLYSIVRKADRDSLPILNLKDQVVYSSWESLFGESGGRMRDNAPIYSFDGRDILRDSAWPEKMVWHGSSNKGHRQTDNYCETWRAGDRAVTGLASSLQAGQLLQQTSSSCSNSFIVLCIENSYITSSKR